MDIFTGAGSSSRVIMQNVFRIKVVCFTPEDGLKLALATPPPAGYPENNISIFTQQICITANGNSRCHNHDMHLQQHVLFMTPDHSNDKRSAEEEREGVHDDGYTLVHLNTTRLCEEFYSDQVTD